MRSDTGRCSYDSALTYAGLSCLRVQHMQTGILYGGNPHRSRTQIASGNQAPATPLHSLARKSAGLVRVKKLVWVRLHEKPGVDTGGCGLPGK